MGDDKKVATRLWRALWSEPLQTLGGFLMTAIGVALTFSEGWEKAAGAVLVAAGGILVTSATSVAFSKEGAIDEIRTRLVALNQTIATACGHIESAAYGLEDGNLDQETLCAVIGNSLQHLTAVASQIQDIVGKKLDSGALAQTTHDFKQLQTVLASAHDRAIESGESETAQAIQDAQSQLGIFAERLSALSEVEDASVQCPYCSATNSVVIGVVGGSSAMPTCASCGQVFHAHRRTDGIVFARPHGRRTKEVVTPIECPQCHEIHPMRSAVEDTEPQNRWCLNCFARQTIDPLQGVVTACVEDAPLDGQVTGAGPSGHALVACPGCGNTVHTFARRGSSAFGVCYECDRLVRGRLVDSMGPDQGPASTT